MSDIKPKGIIAKTIHPEIQSAKRTDDGSEFEFKLTPPQAYWFAHLLKKAVDEMAIEITVYVPTREP
jgi:hypothetical protein